MSIQMEKKGSAGGGPRVAVITGASRGLGAGLARRLGEHGYSLGLCARTEPEVPDGVDPEQVLTGAVDATHAGEVDRFADEMLLRFGAISLWINNAGSLGPVAPAREADPQDVRDAVLVNVVGVMYGCSSYARVARQRPTPNALLVNISSGAATSVYPGWSTYGPTKAAVEHLGRHVAAEEPGIRVVSLSPGVVDTDMQAEIRASDATSFPALDRFERIHREGSWNDPNWVADHLVALHEGRWMPDRDVVRVPDQPADGN